MIRHFDVLFLRLSGSWGRRVDHRRCKKKVSSRQRGKSLENFTQGRSWSGWKNLERNQFPRKHPERQHGLCGKIRLDFFNTTWKWNTIQGKGSSWLNITCSSNANISYPLHIAWCTQHVSGCVWNPFFEVILTTPTNSVGWILDECRLYQANVWSNYQSRVDHRTPRDHHYWMMLGQLVWSTKLHPSFESQTFTISIQYFYLTYSTPSPFAATKGYQIGLF